MKFIYSWNTKCQKNIEARRSRNSSVAIEDNTLHTPQMPSRKPVSPTVVIAPRSPLEFEGDSDYEGKLFSYVCLDFYTL